MGVKIYATTGSFPNMNKTGTALYTFDPEPTKIRFSYRKNNDYDEIPLMLLPEIWDSYTQTRTINIDFTISKTSTTSIKDKIENLDKLSMYYSSSDYPTNGQAVYENGQGEQVYALEVDFPDGDTKLQFVCIESMDYEIFATYISGSITFREVTEVFVI